MPQRQPVLFFSHGAPLALLNEKQTAQYAHWGREVGRPEAALVISAHWLTESPVLGETQRHEDLIYDFHGFPEPLYRQTYPAPGAPELAERVAELIGGVQAESRGLDHGVWVPLKAFWPDADVPVLQLSLPRRFDEAELFELGQQLSPLSDEGIMLIGSGAVTHDLSAIDYHGGDAPQPPYAAFDLWVREVLESQDAQALIDWQRAAPEAARNHPTTEHFRPLILAAGAARGREPSFPIQGFEFGNLSRRMVQWT